MLRSFRHKLHQIRTLSALFDGHKQSCSGAYAKSGAQQNVISHDTWLEIKAVCAPGKGAAAVAQQASLFAGVPRKLQR